MENTAEYAPYPKDLVCLHKKTTGGVIYPYHRHDGYEIFLFLEGNVQLYLEENCYELKPGDLTIMSPVNMHRIYTKDKEAYERITINLRKEVIEQISTQHTDLFSCFSICDKSSIAPISLNTTDREKIVALADHLSATMEANEYGADIQVRNALSEILLLVNKCFLAGAEQKQSIMPELVRDTMLYIQDHINEPLSLEQLSIVMYHNGAYLSRLFKKHTGLSLHAYILDRRIEHAKQQLRKGCSVSETCLTSGFSDYSNFIRNFTAKVGSSPGKWGRENR